MNNSNSNIINPEWIPVFIIYGLLMAISIILYRSLKKKYKAIPDKTVEAQLIKKVSYSDGENENGSRELPYVKAKYQYFIDGKKHKYICKYNGYDPRVSDKLTLYYKTGAIDIRDREQFSIPAFAGIIIGIYFVAGIALLTVLISWGLGFSIPNV